MKHTPLLGKYDAGMLQTAMCVCLARMDLRRLRARTARRESSIIGCDVKSDGRLIRL